MMKRSTWKTTPPQYNPRVEGLLEQDDPQPKGAGKMQRKLNKVRFESRPRKRQRPMPEENNDPIIVAYLDDEEEIGPIIVAGLEGDDEQKDQEEGHTSEEDPLSCPQRKRKEVCPMHIPQNHLPTPHLKMMTGKLKVCLSWLI